MSSIIYIQYLPSLLFAFRSTICVELFELGHSYIYIYIAARFKNHRSIEPDLKFLTAVNDPLIRLL